MSSLSVEAGRAPESGIIEVVNAGRDHPDLIPLWAGESDQPTPAFICEATKTSLDAGETFYTYQRGLPELREAIAIHYRRTYGVPFEAARVCVTGSGMQAIQLAIQAVASSGDEIVIPTPAWPNMAAAAELRGVKTVAVPMDFAESGWQLDMAKLEDAITDKTRAIFLNSPCNPTGWVASLDDLKAVLEMALRRKLWIIADEIYGLFHFGDDGVAPSFLQFCDPDDPVLFVNTMSKNWVMTGWRLGWIAGPARLGQVFENLVQYSTSGVPAFTQRGAIAALTKGENFLSDQVELARKGRALLLDGFAGNNRVQYAAPDGAFYFFFAVEGVADTRQFALDLLKETGVGLAPGTAFGTGGEGFLRLCFARRHDHLEEAVGRINQFLQRG